MFRPRSPRLFSIALAFSVLQAFSGAACSSAPEEPILQQFFRSARLRDSTALASIAVTNFDPDKQGSISSFDIVSVTPESRTPLTLKELARAHDQARSEDEEFTKQKVAYQQENMEAIRRVLKAEGSNAKVTGKDAEVQATWTKYRDDTAQITRKVSDARRQLTAQSSIVELSLDDPRTKVDFTKFDGDMVTKDVTLDASVRTPGGQTSDRTLIVTMQRAVIKADTGEVVGKWIITGIRDTAAAPATKTS
jgi:hypothetical protein